MEKHIDQCRMFIFHPSAYGWCCYILDMLRKRIVVLDPQAGPFGFTSDRVKFHEQISHAIRGAFFKCVQTLFSSWPGTCDGWTQRVSYFDDRKNCK
uniref:Uncharacterized protein n=1 Tax=Triticum urartu TaxID=4572 RepID=A0A8R7K6A5_TRIUA